MHWLNSRNPSVELSPRTLRYTGALADPESTQDIVRRLQDASTRLAARTRAEELSDYYYETLYMDSYDVD